MINELEEGIRYSIKRPQTTIIKTLQKLGVGQLLIDKLVYKDKLNICLLYVVGISLILLSFVIIYYL
jgi:hypothetical protein